MSESDSFIEEVSEEVRRERLFALMRRYGWIAVGALLLIIAGASVNEYLKARTRAAEEALGDRVLAALDTNDGGRAAAALGDVAPGGTAEAVVRMLESMALGLDDDLEAAADRLDAVANDASLPAVYRELAQLKQILLTAGETAPADRIAALEPLTIAGAPYRLLAQEQIAVARIEAGEEAAALALLQDMSGDAEMTQGLRQRVAQLIVVLGGTPVTPF